MGTCVGAVMVREVSREPLFGTPWCRETPISRATVRLIAVVFPVWIWVKDLDRGMSFTLREIDFLNFFNYIFGLLFFLSIFYFTFFIFHISVFRLHLVCLLHFMYLWMNIDDPKRIALIAWWNSWIKSLIAMGQPHDDLSQVN